MTATRLPMILVLAVLVVLIAGCGGDKRRGETETTTPASAAQPSGSSSSEPVGPVRVTKVTDPARRAYVGRVDGLCAQTDPERTRQEERVGNAATSAEAANAYESTIALGRRELQQIEAISVPPGETSLLRANVFDPIRHQFGLRERIRDALAVADVPTLRRLRAELDNSTRALTGFARGYGFRVCGEE
ncbi:MAG: hypothetical protein ACRDPE_01600 [Solirubrobacterales bacterium]